MPGLFHKPFRVKSHAKLKSTERRQFLEELRRRFPMPAEPAAEARLLGGDRRCDLFKSKIVSHAEQTGHVYFAAGQPLFYEFDGALSPTVYALWRLPELADTGRARVPIAAGLLPVLQNGADLMAPGLLNPGAGGAMVERGCLCCLCSKDVEVGGGSSVYVAVGRAAATAAELLAGGGRGKAVLVDHVIGDQLWLRGDRTAGPPAATSAPAAVQDEAGDGDAVAELSAAASAVAIDAESGGGGGGPEASDDGESESDVESTVESADAHLVNCLLHSLLHKVRDKDLPLLCSSLLANCMSRYSPGPLNLKATSYKKFGTFAQAMRDEGLLELSNEKGVLALVSVNRRHPLLQTDPAPVLTFAEPESPSASSTTASADGPAAIEDVLFVTSASGELFKRWGHCKGSCLTGKEVRQLVTEYVRSERLQTSDRPGEVTLDAPLSRLVAQSGGRPVLADSLPWERLFQLCSAAMTPGYRALGRDGSVLLERRGPAPRVSMRVESRAGGKSVTVVSGLPDFGLDPGQFARRVQRALSVSAGPGPNGEVTVQGDQTAHLHRMLTGECGISKKYISGLVPGGKGGKKPGGSSNRGKGKR